MSAVEASDADEVTHLVETPIDVDQAFREAEYQLALLRALGERAARLQRNAGILVLATGAGVTGLAVWVLETVRPDAKLAIAGHLIDVIATFFTLTGIMVGLLGFILAQRERIRTQRDYIEAETARLSFALAEAKRKIRQLQDRSVQ